MTDFNQHDHAPDTPSSVKSRVLETTLVAVRDKRRQRKQNQYTFAGAVALVLVASLSIIHTFNPNQLESTSTRLSQNDLYRPPASPEIELALDVQVASQGNVTSLALSPQQLAKIVFDPNFKFVQNDYAYMWQSKSMSIHMDLPTTTMAITDTRD